MPLTLNPSSTPLLLVYNCDLVKTTCFPKLVPGTQLASDRPATSSQHLVVPVEPVQPVEPSYEEPVKPDE